MTTIDSTSTANQIYEQLVHVVEVCEETELSPISDADRRVLTPFAQLVHGEVEAGHARGVDIAFTRAGESLAHLAECRRTAPWQRPSASLTDYFMAWRLPSIERKDQDQLNKDLADSLQPANLLKWHDVLPNNEKPEFDSLVANGKADVDDKAQFFEALSLRNLLKAHQGDVAILRNELTSHIALVGLRTARTGAAMLSQVERDQLAKHVDERRLASVGGAAPVREFLELLRSSPVEEKRIPSAMPRPFEGDKPPTDFNPVSAAAYLAYLLQPDEIGRPPGADAMGRLKEALGVLSQWQQAGHPPAAEVIDKLPSDFMSSLNKVFNALPPSQATTQEQQKLFDSMVPILAARNQLVESCAELSAKAQDRQLFVGAVDQSCLPIEQKIAFHNGALDWGLKNDHMTAAETKQSLEALSRWQPAPHTQPTQDLQRLTSIVTHMSRADMALAEQSKIFTLLLPMLGAKNVFAHAYVPLTAKGSRDALIAAVDRSAFSASERSAIHKRVELHELKNGTKAANSNMASTKVPDAKPAISTSGELPAQPLHNLSALYQSIEKSRVASLIGDTSLELETADVLCEALLRSARSGDSQALTSLLLKVTPGEFGAVLRLHPENAAFILSVVRLEDLAKPTRWGNEGLKILFRELAAIGESSVEKAYYAKHLPKAEHTPLSASSGVSDEKPRIATPAKSTAEALHHLIEVRTQRPLNGHTERELNNANILRDRLLASARSGDSHALTSSLRTVTPREFALVLRSHPENADFILSKVRFEELAQPTGWGPNGLKTVFKELARM